jgi:aryl-alcohol dehydrogenase-like predicted oxidoreductase
MYKKTINKKIINKNKEQLEFVLGTAQLDTSSSKRYGQCNQAKLTDKDVQEILSEADANHIKRLDTASGYGNNYSHLHQFYHDDIRLIQIGTKIHSLDWVTKETSVEAIKDAYKIEHNLAKETHYMEILSFHNFEDYEKKNAYQALLELKKEGYVPKIGVSIYYYWQAVKVIGDPTMDYIQLPFNILTEFDLEEIVKERIKNYPDNPIIIDVRSIFLQGLLLNWEYKFWKRIPNLDIHRFGKLKTIFEKLCLELVGEFNSENLLQLYFGYLKSFKWINGVVMGLDNLEQLKTNLELFNKSQPIKKEKIKLFKKSIQEIIHYAPAILDPTQWR